MDLKEKAEALRRKAEGLAPEQIIRLAFQEFGKRVNFASSLGEEDQVITDMIAKAAPEIEIFTIDTGRLFSESLELLAKTQKRYKLPYKVYYPDNEAVEDMVAIHGINLFYESVANRKLCCSVRKIEPLHRALKNVDAWICGLRRSQSVTRSTTETFEWDEANQRVKINPLAHWSLDQLKAYIKENEIDVNPLHEKGFISIGCASCTRAVKKGEDIRSGRWWWEEPEQRECGLHNNLNRPNFRKAEEQK